MTAQSGFGRRLSPPPSPGAKAVSARDELAAEARAAFRDRKGSEPSFEPISPAGASPALDAEEGMRAFIGPNWGAFERLWRRDFGHPRLRSSSGAGPMFLGAVWLVYRKRYALGLGLFGAEAAAAYLAPLLALVFSLFLRAIVGRFGKSIVLQAGAAEIAREQSSGDTPALRLGRLRRAGGVSLWLPILLILGEAWLAALRLHGPAGSGMDVAGMLANVRDALP